MTKNISVPPDTRFSIIDGRKIRLEDLGGQPVVVNFWATTCNICRKELPELTRLYEKYSDKGLEIINVAMPYDPPNRVLDVANQNNIPFPVALDINGDAARAFGGINATPTLFLLSPDGDVAMKNVGKTDMEKLEKRIQELLSRKLLANSNKQLVANGT